MNWTQYPPIESNSAEAPEAFSLNRSIGQVHLQTCSALVSSTLRFIYSHSDAFYTLYNMAILIETLRNSSISVLFLFDFYLFFLSCYFCFFKADIFQEVSIYAEHWNLYTNKRIFRILYFVIAAGLQWFLRDKLSSMISTVRFYCWHFNELHVSTLSYFLSVRAWQESLHIWNTMYPTPCLMKNIAYEYISLDVPMTLRFNHRAGINFDPPHPADRNWKQSTHCVTHNRERALIAIAYVAANAVTRANQISAARQLSLSLSMDSLILFSPGIFNNRPLFHDLMSRTRLNWSGRDRTRAALLYNAAAAVTTIVYYTIDDASRCLTFQIHASHASAAAGSSRPAVFFLGDDARSVFGRCTTWESQGSIISARDPPKRILWQWATTLRANLLFNRQFSTIFFSLDKWLFIAGFII